MEFDQLEQGNLSVMEYEQKLNNLIRYAPQYDGQEEYRTKRFLKGLRHELRQILIVVGAGDYYQVVQNAIAHEQEFREEMKSGPGSVSGVYQGHKKGARDGADPVEGRRENKTDMGSQQYSPQCSTSGKFHGNKPCFKLTNGCHKCGAPDH